MRIRIVYYINVLKAIPLHEPQGFIQGRLKIGVSAQKGFGRHLVCGGIRSWSEQICLNTAETGEVDRSETAPSICRDLQERQSHSFAPCSRLSTGKCGFI